MPIYEYRCDSCGHELDALQKLSDAPLTDCPACAASALRRLISKPSFRLKGSGWYETDFKSEKEKKRNLVGAKEDSPKEDKPKSGDDKAAAKKDDKASDSGAKKSDSKKSSDTAKA